ncbi:glycosyltransferase, partial [Rhodopirellula bahusiensis]
MTDPSLGSESTVPATASGSTNAPITNRFRPAKVIMALPAYNEEQSLPELLERIGEAFADSGLPYEVVIVDDGSKD